MAAGGFDAVLGTRRGAGASERAQMQAALARARADLPKMLRAFKQSAKTDIAVTAALSKALDELATGINPRAERKLIHVIREDNDSRDELNVSLTELMEEMEVAGFFCSLWLALGEDYDRFDDNPEVDYTLSTTNADGVARQLALMLCERRDYILSNGLFS